MSSLVTDAGLSIAAVEQATGIARATLRIWERRYGFPQPGRDWRGERTYPPDQVERLRAIAALMARGHRPGRLISLEPAELAALEGPATMPAGDDHVARTGAGAMALEDPVLQLVRAHDSAGLLRHLDDTVRTLGLRGFITGRMADINAMIGTCWARGDLEIYEEHLYTEAVQQLLRSQIAALGPPPAVRPRVLLATLPEEAHGLGLLMAQALLALEGCACTSLGLRVPVKQLVLAAQALRADIVGLSFSASTKPAHGLRGLEQLRGELPKRVAIWAGGSAPALARRRMPGVLAVRHLAEIPQAVHAWKAQQVHQA